ncbi:hypothetical protein CSAL01_03988 [Colletotrichum salicis]|uniref:Uncharacterized protein n=1 Tax=Colletotrichum salicis TaxID=1209931 RepID=A0A135T6Q6_9PEZI|nr:hypothetical protein CSAL01_03988 [Colletotrichum salicis]
MLPQASQHPATRPHRPSPPSLAFPPPPSPSPQSAHRSTRCQSSLFLLIRPLSLFGLAWAPVCTLLHWGLSRSQLAPHRTSTSTGTSTPTATTAAAAAAAAATTAALCYAPLGDPSIFLSFVSCPPLFFSFNLFSTLIFSTQNTLLSLTSGPQHPISSSYYVLSTWSGFSKRSIPPRRRGATAQPFLRPRPPSGFDRFRGHALRDHNSKTFPPHDAYNTRSWRSGCIVLDSGQPR